MQKKGRNTGLIIVWSLGILIIVGILAFMLLGGKIVEESYFNDRDLGLVKVKIQERNFFDFFEQAVTFTQTTANVGDEITLIDNFVIPQTPSNTVPGTFDCIDQAQITIINEQENIGALIKTDSSIINLAPGDNFETTVTYTVNSPGVWTAKTEYRVIAGCSDVGGVVSGIVEGSTNSVTVTEIQETPDCGADPGFTEWRKEKDIINGQVDIRDNEVWDIVNNQCEKKIESSERRTSCNEGYVVEGTEDNLASGEKVCVLAEQGQNNTKTGCTADTTITCNDNSTIVTMECVDGSLRATNNECPVDTQEDQQEDQEEETGTETKYEIVDDECVTTEVNITEQSFFDTLEECEDSLSVDDMDDEDSSLLLLSIVIGVIILIVTIFILLIRRFRR